MAQLRLIQGQSKISTWMYRVALNTAITLSKKTKSPQTDELMDFHHRDYVEDDDEKQQQITLLYKVIKMLPKSRTMRLWWCI